MVGEHEIGDLRRQEPTQPFHASDLLHLLRDPMLEKAVPVRELPRLVLHPVVKGLDAQHGPDPCEKRGMVYRLGEVVVAPGVQPFHDVARIGFRRHQDHRNVPVGGVGLEAPDDLDPVHPRHHDVEEHEVGRKLAHPRERLLAVRCGRDLVALASRAAAPRGRGSGACRRREDERRIAHGLSTPVRQGTHARWPAACAD